MAIDLAPGASGKALAARISDAGPGGTPGGTYQLPANRIRGAAIVDAAQMGSQPLTLALALAGRRGAPWRWPCSRRSAGGGGNWRCSRHWA